MERNKPLITLVRLSHFRKTPDSLLGFLLCQSLVQEGHEVLIVSDAEEEDEIKEEKAAAKDLMKLFKYLGQVRVASSKDIWSKIQHVSTVIGVEPKMIDSALSLKATFNYRLIIATSTKLDKETIAYLTEKVDELWSIGPKLYDSHQMILPKMSKLLHQCLVFFPKWPLKSLVEENQSSSENLLSPGADIESLLAKCLKRVSIWKEHEGCLFCGKA